MRTGYVTILIIVAGGPSVAQDPVEPRPRNLELWEWAPGTTSAGLALQGFEPVSSAGLSWPDGRQSVVTFWPVSVNVVVQGNRMSLG